MYNKNERETNKTGRNIYKRNKSHIALHVSQIHGTIKETLSNGKGVYVTIFFFYFYLILKYINFYRAIRI